MAKFVWCTIGPTDKDRLEARAVLVEAQDLDEAKRKVVADVDGSLDEPESYADSYGSDWFVQRLSTEAIP